MIQVRHLSKAFGRVTAVKGLSFDAPDGAITGLLGANGAGKTTILRMISGVLSPNAGTIRLLTPCSRGDALMARQPLGALLDDHGLYSRAVRRLPLIYREVITLTLEGLPYKDIAQVLGIGESNVGVRSNRARQMLRTLLEDRA